MNAGSARAPWTRGLPIALLGIALVLAGCASAPRPLAVPAVVEVEPEEPVSMLPPAPTPPPEPEPARDDSPPAARPDPPARIVDGATLFPRLAAGFTPPVCVRGEHNRSWRWRYAGHPRPLEAQLRRAMPLMAFVVEQIEARRLPLEFALIPLIESGYRPYARGPGDATGLWQMIGSTARNHGLLVGRGKDDRLSPIQSTPAALDHLEDLYAEFGDWRAAAMAYNAGEGRLRRAFASSGDRRVSGERRLPPGLAAITYAYVAKLHALACLIAEPQRHGLTLPSGAFVPVGQSPVPSAVNRLDGVAPAG